MINIDDDNETIIFDGNKDATIIIKEDNDRNNDN